MVEDAYRPCITQVLLDSFQTINNQKIVDWFKDQPESTRTSSGVRQLLASVSAGIGAGDMMNLGKET
jgi:hypothetical protein